MTHDTKDYEPLRRSSAEAWSPATLELPRTRGHLLCKHSPWVYTAIAGIFLAISLTTNVFLVSQRGLHFKLEEGDCPSSHGKHNDYGCKEGL
jgi:hypothetical protein